MQTKDSASEAVSSLVGGTEKSDFILNDDHFEEHLSLDRNNPNARKRVKCTNETRKKEEKRRKNEGKANGNKSFPGDACSLSSTVRNHDVHNATIDVISSRCSLTPEKPLTKARKKLLVLDLNGLLADIRYVSPCTHPHHVCKVNGKSVFKRPFCDEFLSFCFKAFDIGVWSSRKRHFVNTIVDYIMGDKKHKLLFCWDVSKCTPTGFMTIENRHKPLVLKELRKLWDKGERHHLPRSSGEFSPLNTLLLDDSPYKALCNPLHTGIFPSAYSYLDENDASLGPGGDIRAYLDGLVMAEDVQHYVKMNAFGQRAITDRHPSWEYYKRVIEKVCAPLPVVLGCDLE